MNETAYLWGSKLAEPLTRAYEVRSFEQNAFPETRESIKSWGGIVLVSGSTKKTAEFRRIFEILEARYQMGKGKPLTVDQAPIDNLIERQGSATNVAAWKAIGARVRSGEAIDIMTKTPSLAAKIARSPIIPLMTEDSSLDLDQLIYPGINVKLAFDDREYRRRNGDSTKDKTQWGCEQLLRLADATTDRKGTFTTMLALSPDSENALIFDGKMPFEMTRSYQRGHYGWDFDHILKRKGMDLTLADLPPERKNMISPRYWAGAMVYSFVYPEVHDQILHESEQSFP